MRKHKLVFAVFAAAVWAAFSLSACADNAGSEEDNVAYVVYEAVFLDSVEVAEVFKSIRGEEAPYPMITKDFHVTTAFLPETDSRALYGKEVEVRVIGYKAGAITLEGGSVTHNEGLKVLLKTTDAAMNLYLNEHPANYHITGSYEAQPKYTGYLDFSDCESAEYLLTGTFGAYLNGDTITFNAEDVGKKLN